MSLGPRDPLRRKPSGIASSVRGTAVPRDATTHLLLTLPDVARCFINEVLRLFPPVPLK